VISLACRAQRLKPLMLCDDYNARVAAKNHGIEPLSVHKLLHLGDYSFIIFSDSPVP
jgi:hypothetical protein